MDRRQILKAGLFAPLLGLFKNKEAAITVLPSIKNDTELPIHFWMQTYGPHYDPSSFGFDWTKADSSLLGIYHGEELWGKKASDCPIGTRAVKNDGTRYMCYSSKGITIKGKGVFVNGPPRDT